MRLSRFVMLLVLAVAIAGCATAGQDDIGSDEGATTVTQTPEAVDGKVTTTPSNPTTATQADGDVTERDSDAQPETPDENTEAPNEDREDVEREAPQTETVPTSETVAPVTGEVPQDYLDAVMAAASDESGVPVAELAVIRAEFVEWPDGSLGCPEPGVVYTQAITPGYWVEIRAGDRTLDYRISESGFFRLCTGMGAPHGSGSGVGDSTAPPSGDS